MMPAYESVLFPFEPTRCMQCEADAARTVCRFVFDVRCRKRARGEAVLLLRGFACYDGSFEVGMLADLDVEAFFACEYACLLPGAFVVGMDVSLASRKGDVRLAEKSAFLPVAEEAFMDVEAETDACAFCFLLVGFFFLQGFDREASSDVHSDLFTLHLAAEQGDVFSGMSLYGFLRLNQCRRITCFRLPALALHAAGVQVQPGEPGGSVGRPDFYGCLPAFCRCRRLLFRRFETDISLGFEPDVPAGDFGALDPNVLLFCLELEILPAAEDAPCRIRAPCFLCLYALACAEADVEVQAQIAFGDVLKFPAIFIERSSGTDFVKRLEARIFDFPGSFERLPDAFCGTHEFPPRLRVSPVRERSCVSFSR